MRLSVARQDVELLPFEVLSDVRVVPRDARWVLRAAVLTVGDFPGSGAAEEGEDAVVGEGDEEADDEVEEVDVDDLRGGWRRDREGDLREEGSDDDEAGESHANPVTVRDPNS